METILILLYLLGTLISLVFTILFEDNLINIVLSWYYVIKCLFKTK